MEQKAFKILEKIIYATVATANSSSEPWNTPVFVVCDKALNFYWASGKASQHSRNIKENPRAFLVIYDSTAPWGTGYGVFIEGDATEVTDPDEITKACQLRQTRAPAAKHPPEEFFPDKPRSIYKLAPKNIWMNQDTKVNGYFVDGRSKLDLNRLQGLLVGSKALSS